MTIRYTAEVGRKFHADGSPRLFAGNTIITFVRPGDPAYEAACAFQRALAELPFAAKFAPLPPSSLHMTVMELLCFEVRQPERWSAALSLEASPEQSDQFFLRTVPPIPAPAPRVRYQGLGVGRGLMFNLEPADAAAAAELRGYRDAVAAATGVRAPDHAAYRFHISLAYRLVELEPAEQAALEETAAAWDARLGPELGEIRLEPPRLVFFDDMFAFVPPEERPALRSRRA